ncbi:hypothetical protein QE375_001595 [Microbacterium foliorum]|uniref:Uncharacterized protein n=1 Tax=Microbacterium foliorum TaxID=104336 RepID=A0ABU1HPS1_9MICO|nr:hypothetical protein [Microbacterium foliorum]MDR6142041.1 hypothetical protein [Microbacterium foliorum]
MSITHGDISSDESLGRRVLVRARIIAPCLDSLDKDSEAGKDAIAILKGVIAEIPAAGSRRTRSLSRNGTSMSVDVIDAAFDSDSRLSLQSLCDQGNPTGLPRGRFPKDRPLGRVWPEGKYS